VIPPEVLVTGLAFPEGPRWNEDRLWFSDFVHRTVNQVGLDGEVTIVAQMSDTPSGLGFLPDGDAIVVSLGARQLLRISHGATEVYADLKSFGSDFLNDMVVDGDGNAYVGTRTRSMRPSRQPLPKRDEVDSLILVDPSGRARVVARHLVSPNGMAVSPDGSCLIVAETYGQRLTAYDRAGDGSLSNRRVFAEVPGAYPDGICLDEEGAVWFGSPYTNQFRRVLETGEITDGFTLPGAVACALGGDGRSTLFLLGVDPGMLVPPDQPVGADPPPQMGARPRGGRIWTVAVPSGGAGWP
jgi:sugar lactone lactonase YvrE